MRRRDRGKEVKRKKNKDKPKCIIYIFCEGNTEKIYLKHFENREHNVKVVAVDTEHTDAMGIVKFAKEYLSTNPLDLELGDKGYCVFDSDPKSNPDIRSVFDLLNGARKRGLDCIYSNPSFEVWFALHFEHAPHGLNAKKMKRRVKELLKNEYPDYSETTDIYQYLLGRQPEAKKRAELLYKNQIAAYKTVYCHECNPFTNMHLFIDHIQKVKQKNEIIRTDKSHE